MSVANQVLVSNQAELRAALNSRTADTVIVMKEGNYGGLSFNARDSALGIHIVAADPSRPPTFSTLTLLNANGVSIDGVKFSPNPDLKFANGLTLRGCQNVSLTNDTFVGQTGAFTSQQRGLLIDHTTNVTVNNNNFSGLMRGAVFTESSNLTITNNNVTGNRSEGFNFAGVQHVEISRNVMGNFQPVTGDHPDFIQFWTRGASRPSTDIHIADNRFTQLTAGVVSVQGIFMDNDDHIPYENVVIENNVIQSGMPHGILLQEADGVQIVNNVALTVQGSTFRVGIGVTDSTNVVVDNNTTNALSLLHNTNSTDTGNTVTNTLVPCTGMISPADVGNLRSQSNRITGTAAADKLTGSNLDDFIEGGAGNDIISGGRGNDRIVGGAGDDMLTGGVGADDFVFSADTLRGRETDRLMDFSFSDGDTLEFQGFGASVFGSRAVDGVFSIDSMQTLTSLASLSGVTFSRRGTTDTLVMTVRNNATDVVELQFSNMYSEYVKANGQLM